MEKAFETKAIHTPFEEKDPYNSLHLPIYESNAFEFDTAEAMADAFVGKTSQHTYSRVTNPSVNYFEKRVTQLAGAYSATALNSGMAAISNLFLTIAYTGANIVTSPHLFGNSYSFLATTLKAFGVETRFCDLTNLEEVEKNIDSNTCALYLEIITNPQLEVADLQALSGIASRKNVPLVADTTIVPFCAFNASRCGVDIEVISSTKYISGGATSLGGLIVDYASFDWSRNPRLSELARQAGKATFTTKLRKEIHRNLGAYMTPHVANMQTIGLETLSVRFNQAAGSCLQLARKMQEIPAIVAVNYPGLEGNPFHPISQKQFGSQPGAMLTFDLASKEACFSFLNKLKLIKRATNLFDNKTLIIHPESTIYGSFSAEVKREMNISDRNIRLSVGLENVDDLLQDIQQALS